LQALRAEAEEREPNSLGAAKGPSELSAIQRERQGELKGGCALDEKIQSELQAKSWSCFEGGFPVEEPADGLRRQE